MAEVSGHRFSKDAYSEAVQNREVTGVRKKYPPIFLLTRPPNTSDHSITQNATFTPTVKLRPISGAAALMKEVWEYARRFVRLLPLR